MFPPHLKAHLKQPSSVSVEGGVSGKGRTEKHNRLRLSWENWGGATSVKSWSSSRTQQNHRGGKRKPSSWFLRAPEVTSVWVRFTEVHVWSEEKLRCHNVTLSVWGKVRGKELCFPSRFFSFCFQMCRFLRHVSTKLLTGRKAELRWRSVSHSEKLWRLQTNKSINISAHFVDTRCWLHVQCFIMGWTVPWLSNISVYQLGTSL